MCEAADGQRWTRVTADVDYLRTLVTIPTSNVDHGSSVRYLLGGTGRRLVEVDRRTAHRAASSTASMRSAATKLGSARVRAAWSAGRRPRVVRGRCRPARSRSRSRNAHRRANSLPQP
jgi:hypothetical protein